MSQVAERTVLVVDDDTRVLQLLTRGLQRRLGVRTVSAADLASARSVFRRERPDACVVDMQLPDGNGIDLIREFRAFDSKTRIVLITGYGSMEVGAAATRAGADHVCSKPVAASELASLLVTNGDEVPAVETPSADRALWEHIQRVLQDCRGNKSLAARKLEIDRGTLQRWLDRDAPVR